MSDDTPSPLDFALQVRNNRWRLTVALPSMSAAAAVVARVAHGAGDIKVAVEVYDPVKDRYDRRDYLTFAAPRPPSGGAAFKPLGRELRRLPPLGKLLLAVMALPVLVLAALGAHGLATARPAPVAVAERGAERSVVPPPSRVLPRDWVEAREQKDIPWLFQGEWAADCAGARLNGGALMTVTGRSLFGSPVNWVRAIGNRLLVNTGPDGGSMSTQIRSDGLVLFLEDRFTDSVQTRAERAPYAPEKPLVLSKCL